MGTRPGEGDGEAERVAVLPLELGGKDFPVQEEPDGRALADMCGHGASSEVSCREETRGKKERKSGMGESGAGSLAKREQGSARGKR